MSNASEHNSTDTEIGETRPFLTILRGSGIGIGLGIGVAIGVTLNQMPVGIAIGLVLGMLLGAFLEGRRTPRNPKDYEGLGPVAVPRETDDE